jgi:hypothetical protein
MWWGKLFVRWLVGAHRTDRRALSINRVLGVYGVTLKVRVREKKHRRSAYVGIVVPKLLAKSQTSSSSDVKTPSSPYTSALAQSCAMVSELIDTTSTTTAKNLEWQAVGGTQ